MTRMHEVENLPSAKEWGLRRDIHVIHVASAMKEGVQEHVRTGPKLLELSGPIRVNLVIHSVSQLSLPKKEKRQFLLFFQNHNTNCHTSLAFISLFHSPSWIPSPYPTQYTPIHIMLLEISCASDFLCRYVAGASACTPQVIESFKEHISALMQEKYTNHWDPQRPHIGNGYRAITSFGGKVDPLLCEVSLSYGGAITFLLFFCCSSINHGWTQREYEKRNRTGVTEQGTDLVPQHTHPTGTCTRDE